MAREALFILILLLYAGMLAAFMDDSLNLDRDIVNVRKTSSSELAKDFEVRYKIVRFTIKNYYPETMRFNLSIEGNFSNGDPMIDSCPEIAGKFCLGNGSITINYPSRTYIGPNSIDDLIMDIGVREDATPARYSFRITAGNGKTIYASQSFTLNVGEKNFVYGTKMTKKENSRIAISYLAFFSFLLAMLVFGMVLMSKGRD